MNLSWVNYANVDIHVIYLLYSRYCDYGIYKVYVKLLLPFLKMLSCKSINKLLKHTEL